MNTLAQTLTVRVPFVIRKRGGRKLAIAADGSNLAPPRPRIDSTLVKALARAHRLNMLLEDGRYGSAAELAAAEKINPSYVSRVLRLTLLAPDIIEAIVDGRQADVVEADFMLKPFPAVWAEQRQIFNQRYDRFAPVIDLPDRGLLTRKPPFTSGAVQPNIILIGSQGPWPTPHEVRRSTTCV